MGKRNQYKKLSRPCLMKEDKYIDKIKINAYRYNEKQRISKNSDE